MNIVINKSLEQQMVRIMFNCNPSDDDTQTMLLYNKYSQKISSILLGTNYAQSRYRGGKYLVETPQLEGITEGNYIYKVVNTGSVECNGCSPLAVGTVKIFIDCSDEDLRESLDTVYNGDDDSEDTGFIVYKEEYK